MTEFLELAQKVVPLVVSLLVPIVGVIIKLRNDRQDPGAVHRMKQHAKLHEALPEKAKGAIAELIAAEAAIYAADRLRKARRTLNTNTLIGFIIVAVLVGVIMYGWILLASIWWPAYFFATGCGLFGFFLLLAGSFQLFTYDETPQPGAPQEGPKDATLADASR